jgi:excisionase family DNA binding protein
MLNPKPSTLSVAEAAAQLRVCTKTVYDLVACGALPSFRVGRHVKIDAGQLRDWIAAGGAHVPDPPKDPPAPAVRTSHRPRPSRDRDRELAGAAA